MQSLTRLNAESCRQLMLYHLIGNTERDVYSIKWVHFVAKYFGVMCYVIPEHVFCIQVGAMRKLVHMCK